MSQKTLLFDMGNVLLRFQPRDLLSHYTDDQAQLDRIHNALFTSLWYELDLGVRTSEEILAEVYQRILPHDHSVLETFMATWYTHMRAIEPMENLIQELKKLGYPLILCSNASMQFFEYQRHYTVLQHFDAFVISAKIKHAKPHQAFFDYVLKTYHLQARSCIFVDDLVQNIEGAKQKGFNVYHFRDDAEQLRKFILSQ